MSGLANSPSGRDDGRQQEILDLLRRIPQLADVGDLAVEPLTGVQSLNNSSWIVTTPGRSDAVEKFVLRVPEPGRAAHLGIDRAEEAAAARAAASVGIGPEVVYCDTTSGDMLTRWVTGRAWAPEDLREPENLRRTAELLRAMHAVTDIPGEPGAVYRRIRHLIGNAQRLGLEMPAHLPEALHRLDDLEARLAAMTDGRCGLNHNDLWANNILGSPERVWFMDWEFAGAGDGLYDLASVSMSGGYGPQDEARLFSEYGLSGPEEHAAVQSAKWVVRFFEGAWSLTMHQLTSSRAPNAANGPIPANAATSGFDYFGHATYMLDAVADGPDPVG
ncbi:phosphotransferase [Actinospica robiniae]|uniref:phosphotransferase n=1 Tax=Actinospica robiniae TaxID=304901 RepID=UPI000422792A|nr:phosphotransferase [Actinospica robiniae]